VFSQSPVDMSRWQKIDSDIDLKKVDEKVQTELIRLRCAPVKTVMNPEPANQTGRKSLQLIAVIYKSDI
jgi:hypothetical protein